MKPGILGAVFMAVSVTVTLACSAANAQTIKNSDLATQTAVADYNAGNFGAARSEFLRAAKKGSRLAEFNYAMMLVNGEGGPADVDEGKKWLRKAADANMTQAQYVYGKMFDDGEFVDRDPVEAHRWFLRAANQGHVQAELALANQFLDGRGTPRPGATAASSGSTTCWFTRSACSATTTGSARLCTNAGRSSASMSSRTPIRCRRKSSCC